MDSVLCSLSFSLCSLSFAIGEVYSGRNLLSSVKWAGKVRFCPPPAGGWRAKAKRLIGRLPGVASQGAAERGNPGLISVAPSAHRIDLRLKPGHECKCGLNRPSPAAPASASNQSDALK